MDSKDEKIILSLFDLIGVAVIIKIPTGVIYTNQTCGTACLHPKIEGALLPVNNDFDLKDYEDSLEIKLSTLLKDCNRLSLIQADEVDDLLSGYPQTEGIKIDRKQISESHESWLHVILKPTKYAGFTGSKERKGVLTWPNSD